MKPKEMYKNDPFALAGIVFELRLCEIPDADAFTHFMDRRQLARDESRITRDLALKAGTLNHVHIEPRKDLW